jgi:nucleoside-diphosphate-sugar epimerase
MMQLLITGADLPLGRLAANALRSDYDLRLCGSGARVDAELSDLPYSQADLRDPSQAAALTAGVAAILHLAPYSPAPGADPATEKHTLDTAGRGAYVLLHAALRAGVRRVVLASRLDLLAAHPANAVIDETWKALPETSAAGLAPYLAELTLREFVRAEDLEGVCLRLGDLNGGADHTAPADALSAIRKALDMDLTGHKHRWWLYHIASGGRFVTDAAQREPLRWRPQGQ